MPVFALTDELVFPPPELATPQGILAVGGDLRPERLLLAYGMGIFPWPVEGWPLVWHSPDPRLVLVPSALATTRSLRQSVRRERYVLTMDQAFARVIQACSSVPRPGQDGTWITDDIVEAYVSLHALGYAHSIEAWADGELVGGLYGVSLGDAFCGESMFARAPDASKVAFVAAVRQMERWGIELVDCQVHTEHLARFGAVEWPRPQFLKTLRQAVKRPTRRGPWSFDADFLAALPRAFDLA